MKRTIFLVIFLFMPLLLNADTIYLKGGRKIVGKVVEERGDTVVVNTTIGGLEATTTFKKDQIQEVVKGPVQPEGLTGVKGAKKRKQVLPPGDVRSLVFYVNEYLGRVEGFVLFLDQEGEQKATTGTVFFGKYKPEDRSINRRSSRMGHTQEQYNIESGPVKMSNLEEVKRMSFGPDDFRSIKQAGPYSGVFGLPFVLDPGLVKRGDRIEVSFMNLRSDLTRVSHGGGRMVVALPAQEGEGEKKEPPKKKSFWQTWLGAFKGGE